ncbi:hypothetical protein JCM17823_23790 [Halorubrum gandharaense]
MIELTDADDWFEIDSWWESFRVSHSLGQLEQRESRLDSRWWDGVADDIDQWVEQHRSEFAFSQLDSDTLTVTHRWNEGHWETLDPWWESYDEIRTEVARQLYEELERSDERWQHSNSRFDSDPLSADWRRHHPTRGPLRPNQEENWSQWLAHLLRGADGILLEELFGERCDESPQAVEREVYLPAENESDRYADILVFLRTRGLSIEVKKGDEHYKKTTHTASLVEDEFLHEWMHTLLLPKHKHASLRDSFERSLCESESGRLTIHSEDSTDVNVVFWEEVSHAIRAILLNDETVPPHWEASAYLFCTLIEQKLLDYNPKPVVSKLVSRSDVVHSSQSLRIATGSPEEQISYLRKAIP